MGAAFLQTLRASPAAHRTTKPGVTGQALGAGNVKPVTTSNPGKADATPSKTEAAKPHKPGEPSPPSLQGDAVPHPDGQTPTGNKWDKINAAANIAPMAMMLPGMMPQGGGSGGAEAQKTKHEQEKAEQESRYHQALGAADQARSTISSSMISNI